jgi:hypothetical protein
MCTHLRSPINKFALDGLFLIDITPDRLIMQKVIYMAAAAIGVMLHALGT